MGLDHWLVRLGVVVGATWAAHKFLPLGAVGKTVVLAVGGISGAAIVAANVPLVNAVMAGRLPVSASSSSAS